LAQRLAAGRFVITAEIVPPVSCSPADLTAKALPLSGLADAVNVTDGAGAHAHMSATAAAALLIGIGIEPILQLTCRDRNRIALQGELMGAAALGVRNVLLLRGDDPTAGDQPEAKPVFYLDSRTLAETARAAEFFLADGVIVTGNATGAPATRSDVSEAVNATKLPVLVGSGITPTNIDHYAHAHGFIVGSSLKAGGVWSNPLEPDALRAMMSAFSALPRS